MAHTPRPTQVAQIMEPSTFSSLPPVNSGSHTICKSHGQIDQILHAPDRSNQGYILTALLLFFRHSLPNTFHYLAPFSQYQQLAQRPPPSRVMEDIFPTSFATLQFQGIRYFYFRGNTTTTHKFELRHGNSHSSHTLAIATRACITHNMEHHTRFTLESSDRSPSSYHRRLHSVFRRRRH